MADVGKYNGQMDELQADMDGINSDIATLKTFIGNVQVDNVTGTFITTVSLRVEVTNLKTRVDTQYTAAEESHADIRLKTEGIQIYNGNVSVFTNRVSAAMVTITNAKTKR